MRTTATLQIKLYFAALLAAASISGATIYDNGAPALTGGFEMTRWLQADDFFLPSGGRLQTVKFWTFEGVDKFQGSFTWRIYSNSPDGPGSLMASGSVSSVDRVASGLNLYGYPEYVNVFDLPPVDLPPGTYWLALHNGFLSILTNQLFYWETADANGSAPSYRSDPPFDLWGSHDCPECTSNPSSQLAFQLGGIPGPTITQVKSAGHSPQISFSTVFGQRYRVEYKDLLSNTTWIPVAGSESIAGTGGTIQAGDSDPNLATRPRRFYRVVLL